MRYKLKKNAYLTVIGLTYHYNRHFEKGEQFDKEGVHGQYVTLLNNDFRVWVHRDRMAECFELVWKDTKIFKDSPYSTENGDED